MKTYRPHGTGKYQPHRLHDLLYKTEPKLEICPRCHKPAVLDDDGKRGRLCGACRAGF